MIQDLPLYQIWYSVSCLGSLVRFLHFLVDNSGYSLASLLAISPTSRKSWKPTFGNSLSSGSLSSSLTLENIPIDEKDVMESLELVSGLFEQLFTQSQLRKWSQSPATSRSTTPSGHISPAPPSIRKPPRRTTSTTPLLTKSRRHHTDDLALPPLGPMKRPSPATPLGHLSPNSRRRLVV